MKKNVFMRAALLLLVLTLITSCFVGGTFAKYTTGATKNQESARVAKWGVAIQVSSDTAFSKTYDEATDAPDTNPDTLTVEAEEKVVAPGTSGTLLTLDISGSPEVDALVTITPTLTLTGWKLADNTEYCPIVFTVGTVKYMIGTGEDTDAVNYCADIAGLKSAVVAAIAASAGYYEVGTSIATDVDVSWEWAIGDASANDTYLGDQAAANNASTISISLSVSVTQVD